MKWNILILVAIAAAAFGLGTWMQDRPTTPLSQPDIPTFQFIDHKGKSQSSNALKGKIVIVNFWASWCAPCVVEFPHLVTLARDNPRDVVLVALSSDTSKEAMERFLAKQDLSGESNIIIGLDNDTTITRDLFRTYKLPETFIFDRNGRLAHKMIGADWTVSDIQKKINTLK